MPEENVAKRASDFQRLDDLENKIVQIQIDGLRKDIEDHEKRVRLLEETATKFNFILYLTMGGGLVSLVDLALLVFLLVQAVSNQP
jgi:hypothetical protein